MLPVTVRSHVEQSAALKVQALQVPASTCFERTDVGLSKSKSSLATGCEAKH